jgi:hypothetical protein
VTRTSARRAGRILHRHRADRSRSALNCWTTASMATLQNRRPTRISRFVVAAALAARLSPTISGCEQVRCPETERQRLRHAEFVFVGRFVGTTERGEFRIRVKESSKEARPRRSSISRGARTTVAEQAFPKKSIRSSSLRRKAGNLSWVRAALRGFLSSQTRRTKSLLSSRGIHGGGACSENRLPAQTLSRCRQLLRSSRLRPQRWQGIATALRPGATIYS